MMPLDEILQRTLNQVPTTHTSQAIQQKYLNPYLPKFRFFKKSFPFLNNEKLISSALLGVSTSLGLTPPPEKLTLRIGLVKYMAMLQKCYFLTQNFFRKLLENFLCVA